MSKIKKNRWAVLIILTLFALLHQADKLLIGPLTTTIMKTFNINEARMGVVFSGALLVGGVLYPIWGYLFDRYSRPRLIALASFIWGVTTWFSALSPNYAWFVVMRASTGIDDASYPGVYSLLADYFVPYMRGRVYSLIKLTMPAGYVLGTLLATIFAAHFSWRGVFWLTGSSGLIIAVIVLLLVKEIPRGTADLEPEGVISTGKARFSWQIARSLFKRRTLVALYAQGFFGIFSISVVTFWFFRYLEIERGYKGGELLGTVVLAVFSLGAGFLAGGALGDRLFKQSPRGRLLAGFATLIGALLLIIAILVPRENIITFTVFVALGAFFASFAAPNVGAAISDISLPEVRSTAIAIQSLIETTGTAIAPFIAGVLATKSDLSTAFIIIITGATVLWAPCYAIALINVAGDIEKTREELRARKEYY